MKRAHMCIHEYVYMHVYMCIPEYVHAYRHIQYNKSARHNQGMLDSLVTRHGSSIRQNKPPPQQQHPNKTKCFFLNEKNPPCFHREAGPLRQWLAR